MSTAIPDRATRAAVVIAAALTLAIPGVAGAHDPGLSSLDVGVTRDRIVAVLSLAAIDARTATTVSGVSIDRFAFDAVEVLVDGLRLRGTVQSQATDQSGTVLTLAFDGAIGSQLTIRSTVPRGLSRGHRQLLRVHGADGQLLAERMLDEQMHVVDLDLSVEQRSSGGTTQFLRLGVSHILGGYDHLLFLAALLLGVQRLSSVVKTVTAFTVAHSLTLSAAALGIVQVPGAVVEPLIAASIVIVGIENLLRGEMDSRWKLTFAFGLVHGFGFAGALRDLGIGSAGMDIAAPLAWFNAGVEVGQIVVATLLWPLIRNLNARPALRLRLAPLCSLLVVAAGSYWMVQRTFF